MLDIRSCKSLMFSPPPPVVLFTLRARPCESASIRGGSDGTGLGKSMGNYFMELGANLIITSRKEDVLFATAEEFSNLPG